MTNLILILVIVAILISGTIVPDQIAFADDDDHEKECKEDLEDFIKKINKLIDKNKLSEGQGQSLISSAEELIENDCGTVEEIELIISEVKALVESNDLKKNDSRKLFDELEDAKKEIEKAIKKAEKNTLEYKCAKQLEKKHLNLFGLLCGVIFALQDSIDDLQEQIDTMQLTPGPEGPPGSEGPPGPPGSGGTTDAPALSFTFSPQPAQPLNLDCNAEIAGTIYYLEFSGAEGQMCACVEGDGDGLYVFKDLFTADVCFTP